VKGTRSARGCRPAPDPFSPPRSLGLDPVGEGIETPGQLRTLRALGCAQGQGYLLGRPGRLDLTATGRSVG